MNNTFSSLIEKYKAGILSNEEVAYLLATTGTSTIEQSIAVIEEIIASTEDYKSTGIPDKNRAWERFNQHIETEASPAKKRFSLGTPLTILLGILLIGIAIYYLGNKGNTIQYASSENNVKAISLTDFSQVKLNEGSKLVLDEGFNKSERIVTMEGEAFFDVSHNKEKPFIIHLELGSITVLGTQFNVNAQNGADSIIISVKSGKVAFEPNNANKPFIVEANEELTYNVKSGNAVIKPVIGYNAGAWFDKNIKFDGTTVSEMIEQLSQIYDVKYEVDNKKLLSCKFTGNFKNTELKDIHQIISKTLNLQIVKTGDKNYKITGKACN